MNQNLKQSVINKLEMRGANINDIAKATYRLQKPQFKKLKLEECVAAVSQVLEKREALNIILVGINLDACADVHRLDPTLQYIMKNDEPLFGVDEDLAVSLCNLFGSIAVTNYGYLDVNKHGKAAELDLDTLHHHVFLDDLVSAVAASAAAKLAHTKGSDYDKRTVKD